MIPPHTLIAAYASGYFPMGMDDGQVGWFSPDPRGILPLEAVHLPKRLARVVRQGRSRIAVNTAFRDVIAACAGVRDGDEEGSWISDEILESYCELHRLGWAHSVEAWTGDRLAGGLYGVGLRGAFFGESMFHRETDASKVALAALVERLTARDYRLLDVQWVTPHLARFGAVEIPRRRYLRLLEASLRVERRFADAVPALDA